MKALLLVLPVLLAACATCSSTKTGSGDPDPVIHEQPGKELCDAACVAMSQKLKGPDGSVGCEEALPAPAAPGHGEVPCYDGDVTNGCISCVSWCVAAHESGSFWNTQCISQTITTCEQIETVCNTQ